MRLEACLPLETVCPLHHPAQLQNQYPSLLMKLDIFSEQLRKIMESFLSLEPSSVETGVAGFSLLSHGV